MFKKPFFSLSILLVAMLSLRCNSSGKEKKARMDTAINAWADVEAQYRERGERVIDVIKEIRLRIPGDTILFTKFEQTLKAANTISLIANSGLDMSAQDLRMYIQRQSVPSGFLSWAAENKDRLDGNLLQAMQSTFEQSENDIRRAKIKYNEAAEAYNKLETDESKELPTQF